MAKETEAKTYLMLDESGEVINRIVWDGAEAWQPPEGVEMVAHDAPEAAKIEAATASRLTAQADALAKS